MGATPCGASSNVIYVPRPNLAHCPVTPSQKRIVADLPWRNVRKAVQASGIPTSSADDDCAVRDKLHIAIWAAETLHTSAHVRALPSDVQHCVLAALGAEPTWAPPLQDAYTDSVLRLCKACPWAVDPSLSPRSMEAAPFLQPLLFPCAEGFLCWPWLIVWPEPASDFGRRIVLRARHRRHTFRRPVAHGALRPGGKPLH